MSLDHSVCFPPFRLDLLNACLWRDTERIPLIPKDFALLSHLATHPQRVVSHEEIFQAVWKGTVVSHGVLKVHMYYIRRALNDDAAYPRFIETVPRQGYRFIASPTFPLPVFGQGQFVSFERVLGELQAILALAEQEKHARQLKKRLEDVVQTVQYLSSASQGELSRAA